MTTEEKKVFNYSLSVCNVLNMFHFVKNLSFVVDKVAFGLLLLRVVRFSPVTIIPDMFSTHSFKHRRRYVILAVDSVIQYHLKSKEPGKLQLCATCVRQIFQCHQ